MVCVETQYLGINKILLLAIGLWPYQQSRFTRFQFIFFFAILMTSIIFQLTTFVTTLKYTPDLIATILSTSSFLIILVIKYYTVHVNIKDVKKFFIQLQNICNELKDKNEIAIVEKYGYIAKCYTVAHMVLGICAIFVIIIIQLWSTSDDVLSMNVTRPRNMYFITEYFVDQEKYFFLIQLHINAAICIGGIAMIATGTMFIAYFKFICAMFQISSYRIEHALKINILQNIMLKTGILRFEDLIYAIDIHRQAINLPKRFLSTFGMMYFILAQLFVVSLCFNLVRIVQIVTSKQTIKEAYFPATIATINILYFFISNSLGQNMTDYNNYVFDTVYRVKWYVTPLRIQRIILFLLLRGTKNFTLNVGLFIPSLECFATLVKASVSYFTVVLSTQ